jgi:uncharacterized protein YbjT (DUF2867 family)
LIAGATGLIGGQLVRLAVKEYEQVAAVTRRPLTFSHANLREVQAPLDALGALPPADAAFGALGTTMKKAGSQEAFRRVDLDYVVAFARAAHLSGAHTFCVVSSVGASPTGNFYLRVKAEMEEAVRGLGFPSLHIFRPSFLVGKRAESRAGEALGIAAAQALAFLLAGSWRRYRAVRAETVAAAMLTAARQAKPGLHIHHYDSIVTLASQ